MTFEDLFCRRCWWRIMMMTTTSQLTWAPSLNRYQEAPRKQAPQVPQCATPSHLLYEQFSWPRIHWREAAGTVWIHLFEFIWKRNHSRESPRYKCGKSLKTTITIKPPWQRQRWSGEGMEGEQTWSSICRDSFSEQRSGGKHWWKLHWQFFTDKLCTIIQGKSVSKKESSKTIWCNDDHHHCAHLDLWYNKGKCNPPYPGNFLNNL